MEPPIVAFDLWRMFFGDQPILILAEIAVRTAIVYGYALLLLRWIGGRSVAQLSVVEFLLVIALGSAVGDGMLYADVPLVHACVVITVAVLIDKGIDLLSRRYDRARRLVAGSPIEVVRDGRILTDGIVNRGIGGLELMEMLRRAGVANLGEVQTAYLEATGQVSVFRLSPPRQGLAIVPPHEIERPPAPMAGHEGCCVSCGALLAADSPAGTPCPLCHATGRAVPRVGT